MIILSISPAGAYEHVLTPAPAGAPTLVFLHEGLGSVSMWREFPARLAEHAGCGALLYSRLGHGHSDPETAAAPARFSADARARDLAALLGGARPRDVVLVGHSDGGTIALAYLAAGHTARGAIVAAPHVIDEPVTWRAIAEARARWPRRQAARAARAAPPRSGRRVRGLDQPMARARIPRLVDPAAAAAIRVPLLAVQGEDDIYGTMRQIDEIASARRRSGRIWPSSKPAATTRSATRRGACSSFAQPSSARLCGSA